MDTRFETFAPTASRGSARAAPRWSWIVLLLAAVLVAPLARAANAPTVKPIEVAPGVYFVQGESALGSTANRNFISNGGFVVTSQGVIVIDALGSPELANELLRAIRAITPQPVRRVIVTHYHADHVYGLQVFKDQGAEIVAQERGKEYLNSETASLRMEASRRDLKPWIDASTRLVPADLWITDALDFSFGGVDFQVRHVGPAHTPEDVAVYLPKLRVLFAGDLVFRGRIPYVGEADSGHWIEGLDRLLKFEATILLPGHGPVSTDPRADLTLTRDYLVYLRKAMGEAALQMEPFDDVYKRTDWSRFESLPLFRVANRMNAYNTYLLMEKQAK